MVHLHFKEEKHHQRVMAGKEHVARYRQEKISPFI